MEEKKALILYKNNIQWDRAIEEVRPFAFKR